MYEPSFGRVFNLNVCFQYKADIQVYVSTSQRSPIKGADAHLLIKFWSALINTKRIYLNNKLSILYVITPLQDNWLGFKNAKETDTDSNTGCHGRSCTASDCKCRVLLPLRVWSSRIWTFQSPLSPLQVWYGYVQICPGVLPSVSCVLSSCLRVLLIPRTCDCYLTARNKWKNESGAALFLPETGAVQASSNPGTGLNVTSGHVTRRAMTPCRNPLNNGGLWPTRQPRSSSRIIRLIQLPMPREVQPWGPWEALLQVMPVWVRQSVQWLEPRPGHLVGQATRHNPEQPISKWK